MGWREEIDELHAFFERYFLGTEESLDRVDAVLAPDFHIVGPHGVESDRAATMEMLRAGHGHTNSLTITTAEHRLVLDTPAVVVASYQEHHQLTERRNARLSTVVFIRDPSAPNGLLWLRVHETWMADESA